MTNPTVPLTADRQELSALVAAISGAVIRLDADCHVRSWSDGARECFELHEEEVVGRPLESLLDVRGRDRFRAVLADTAQSRTPARMEAHFHRRCGTTFPGTLELGALYGAESEFGGWVAIVRPCAEQPEGVAALLEWKARYEAAIKVSGMLLRDWKPEEDQVTCAGNVEAILGEPLPTLKGGIEGWAELIHPEDRESFFHEFESMLAKRTPFELEYRLRTKGGAYTIVRDRGHLFFDADDRIVRVAAVITDISEQRALEDRLRHSQKMEAFGRLAGGVAHDFNNLLTVISGYTELMKEDTSADDPRNMLVTEIEKAAARASSLTAQLLAFSRQQVLKLCVLNLNDVLADVGRMLRRLIGEHIRLQLQPARTLGAVKGDLGQLEQVLINLAVNARDAMPDGGTLTITTTDVHLAEGLKSGRLDLSPGEYVLLTVTDTGVGMTKEVLAQVFEPFFTTKAPGQGTGLGLATCYGIIHQCGGQIAVESEAGKGTIFQIYLPRAREVEVREPNSTPRAIQGGSERILLVEDDATVRKLSAAVLKKLGYDVVEAENGEEALAIARRLPAPAVDLLITDMVMPRMGGRDLANHFGVEFPTARILFTSGYPTHVVDPEGDGPCRGFIQKPFVPKTLAAQVRSLLDTPVQPQLS